MVVPLVRLHFFAFKNEVQMAYLKISVTNPPSRSPLQSPSYPEGGGCVRIRAMYVFILCIVNGCLTTIAGGV
jgi:hypothetical protein